MIRVVRTQKGGVGKTTVVTHGAWWSAEHRKRRTAVVDCDSQGNASNTLRKYAVPGITASRLFDPTPLPAIVAGPAESGDAITLIASDKKLDDFSRDDAKVMVTSLLQHLKELTKTFDDIWIDTGPTGGITGVVPLIVADSVISPIDLEEYSIQGVEDTIQQIFGVQQRFNPRLKFIGILPSRVDGHSQAQKTALMLLTKKHGPLVVPASIRESEAIASVARARVPVWRIDSWSGREHGQAMLRLFDLIEVREATK